jgi:hypothetical protein
MTLVLTVGDPRGEEVRRRHVAASLRSRNAACVGVGSTHLTHAGSI